MDDAKIINVTPNASKHGLAEILTKEGKRHGIRLRHLAGHIIEYAVANKKIFDQPLNNPMSQPGVPIQLIVSSSIKEQVSTWAKERKRSLGSHVAFILEKFVELNLYKELALDVSAGIAVISVLEDGLTDEMRVDQPSSRPSPVLDLYFDLDMVPKDKVQEILIGLNNLYKALGGSELIILEDEIGVLDYTSTKELV